MPDKKVFMDGLTIFEDRGVRQFLLIGPDNALVIDTGYADTRLLETVRQHTDRPLQVLLTHADPDHAGGLSEFREGWLHERDWPLVATGPKLHPLRDGDVFRCGDFALEVIEIPGHTPGSVAFFDSERGLLISGDSIQKEGPIYMFGSYRNLDRYIESLRRLLDMSDRIRLILPSHHLLPIGPEWIGRDLEDAISLREGRLAGEPDPLRSCWIYHGQWTDFLAPAPVIG